MPFSEHTITVSSLPQNYTKTPKTVIEYFIKTRIDNKLTQREVAQIIGVSQTAINNWENGKRKLMGEHLKKVIQFIGLNSQIT